MESASTALPSQSAADRLPVVRQLTSEHSTANQKEISGVISASSPSRDYNSKPTPVAPHPKEETMREISSQMMGRFSSPEHALLQGRNTSAGGVPQSTASFKLNMQQNSSVL